MKTTIAILLIAVGAFLVYTYMMKPKKDSAKESKTSEKQPSKKEVPVKQEPVSELDSILR